MSERYLTIANILIGVVFIPYLLLLNINDTVKLHRAGSVVIDALKDSPSPKQSLASTARQRSYYNLIEQRDIFNLPLPTAAPVEENDTLDIKLIGTCRLGNGSAFAVIASAQGEQTLYHVGDKIPDAGSLLEVAADRVVILHNGRRLALELFKEGQQPSHLGPKKGSRVPAGREPHHFQFHPRLG